MFYLFVPSGIHSSLREFDLFSETFQLRRFVICCFIFNQHFNVSCVRRSALLLISSISFIIKDTFDYNLTQFHLLTC